MIQLRVVYAYGSESRTYKTRESTGSKFIKLLIRILEGVYEKVWSRNHGTKNRNSENEEGQQMEWLC